MSAVPGVLDVEHRMLLGCALRTLPAATSPAAIDWTRLEAAARAHQLRPRLSASLSAGALPIAGAAEARARAAASAGAHEGHSLMRAGELVQVLEVLEKGGVDAVPFKGPAFAAIVDDGPRLRECSDLDILVRVEAIGRAVRALAPLGYEPLLPGQAIESPWLALATDELLLVRDSDASLVELHWRLGQRWYPAAIGLEAMWPRLRREAFLGASVRWPAPEDLFLLHVTDGMKAGGASIRWLADLAAMMRSYPAIDWEQVRQVAVQHGGLATVRIALAAVDRALRETGAGEALPPGARALLAGMAGRERAALYEMYARVQADAPLGSARDHFAWAMRIADNRTRVAGEIARYLAGPAFADLLRMPPRAESDPLLRLRSLARRLGAVIG
jgi:hypothetical protein